jgi:alkylation response protein AidB-like acyl-CoA dehydrogenase
MPDPAYPVQLTIDYPDRPLNRVSTGLRIFAAIPILVVLVTVSGGNAGWGDQDWGNQQIAVGTGGLLVLAPLLMLVFRHKYPRWWFEFNRELMRFSFRVSAYLALMEPQPGADISGIETRAVKENGHYLLNGQKLSFAKAGEDYYAVVFATTGPETTKDRLTCFLVDKETEGLSVASGAEKQGWQIQVREPILLTFDQCRVPAENVLGEEGKALSLGKKWLPARRVIRGARCVGIAQRLLEEATTQAQSFQSFGQFVAKRTSIEAALAEIAVAIHAGRLMVHEAATKADNEEPLRNEAAMVKLFTTRMIQSVADKVTHIFNGPPNIAGLPMESLCRHTLATSATELALELQRSIVAQDILKGLKV